MSSDIKFEKEYNALVSIQQEIISQDNLSKIEVENLEKQIKLRLHAIAEAGINGQQARKLSKLFRELGLIIKRKSYTLKCATPFGYALFLHQPNQGFSFQQHLDHKIEAFHILDVLPGGFVFLSTIEAWEKHYDKDAFNRWLQGETNELYDQFTFTPNVGDIVIMDKTKVVHTVIGCILEEFANESTDLVDRLHDQNEGKVIPDTFTNSYASNKINNLAAVTTARIIQFEDGQFKTSTPQTIQTEYGSKTITVSLSFIVRQIVIQPGKTSEWFHHPELSSNLFIQQGTGQLSIRDTNEHQDRPPVTRLDLKAKQTTYIPHNIHWRIHNTGKTPLIISEHQISLSNAFKQALEG